MTTPVPNEISDLIRALLSGSGELNIERTTTSLGRIRSVTPDSGGHVDRVLIENLAAYRKCLREAQSQIGEFQELLEKLSAPPQHPAIFHRVVGNGENGQAVVQIGNAKRVVIAGEDVDLDALARGDEVFLNHEQNLIIATSPEGPPQCGETALFERRLADGRLVLRWHDDPFVVDAAGQLASVPLKSGDGVRFDRNAWMAFEKIEMESGRRYLLGDVPNISLTSVGGQAGNLESLLSVLSVILVEPTRAAEYGLTGRNSILMCGPPGCGKTLMARAAVSEIARLTGRKCHFAIIKPAEWESPYVGATQNNIRQCFESLREASEHGFAILFMDEIESIGRIRGGAVSHHSDKFLAAFLAELDGFADRRNIAIICATNRKDLLDSALYERLSDLEIHVRPLFTAVLGASPEARITIALRRTSKMISTIQTAALRSLPSSAQATVGTPRAGSPSTEAAIIDSATTPSATGFPGSKRSPNTSSMIAMRPTPSTR